MLLRPGPPRKFLHGRRYRNVINATGISLA
jgi:hypothetical protein